MSGNIQKIAEIDSFIGNKIYSLRLALGLSRQQLSKMIGVTHQQLQKYEKGTNKISVSRLYLIAHALGENIGCFYDKFEKNTGPVLTKHQRMCIELSRNFMRIKSAKHQSAVNSLVKSLVRDLA